VSNNKIIVIDYLNFYTVIHLIFRGYNKAFSLYRHLFLEDFYVFILKIFKVDLITLDLMMNDKSSSSIFVSTSKEKRIIINGSRQLKHV